MASKVLVPTASFAKLQVKQPSPESSSGYVLTTDPAARVAHLEHSVRFLQEQHRLMLTSLHAEIEALRNRNRDLQFQLIFNRESSPKVASPAEIQQPDVVESHTESPEEERLNGEVARLQQEVISARGEARAAEARSLQLQRLIDAQAVDLRELSNKKCQVCEKMREEARVAEGVEAGLYAESNEMAAATRGELRVRLAEAESLVRRLRGEAERARREVQAVSGAGVTNLLFDSRAANAAHVACMKNSLQAQLRSGTMELGYHNSYQFPPLPHEYWPRDHRTQDVCNRSRRPLALPDLTHATIYANNHARPRGNFDVKNKRAPNSNVENISPDTDHKRPNEQLRTYKNDKYNSYPELKVVVTKVLPDIYANNPTCVNRPRARRPRNRPPPEN